MTSKNTVYKLDFSIDILIYLSTRNQHVMLALDRSNLLANYLDH